MKKISLVLLGNYLCASLAFAGDVVPPPHFDLREALGGLNQVKDQKMCGNDYAFSMVAAMETAILMKEGIRVTLSEQEVTSCDTTMSGCRGGWLNLDYAVKHGISLESEFPYQATEVVCKPGLTPFRKATSWGFLPNEAGKSKPSRDAIKAAIMNYGAVVSAMYSGSAVQKYESGVFNTCENQPINHTITIVGWDDSEGYWILRNTWGKKWGEEGYLRMAYDCNHIGELVSYVDL